MEDNKINKFLMDLALEQLKIVFLGTPEFGAIVLEGLVKNGYKPVLVITEPDKPVGRHQIITPSAVKKIALKHGLSVSQDSKAEDQKAEIKNLRPDLLIVAAYRRIIPKDILEIPRFGALNVHPSLLPKYRGASPIQAAILENEKETGTTIILMDEKMDHGNIISSFSFFISNPKIIYSELEKKLAEAGTELLVKIIPQWIKKEIKTKAQDDSKATYTKIIKKEDGKIDWEKPADRIERQIRAFYSWPGTFTYFSSKLLKVLEADVLPTSARKIIGEVFLTGDKKIAVQTGQNCLILQELQLEGKKTVGAEDFLRGHADFIGSILK